MTDDRERPRVIVRKDEAKKFLGFSSDSQLAEKEKNDADFPKSFPLSDSGRARGWWEDEIVAYQRQRNALKGVRLPKPRMGRAR